jgi:Na+/H+-dicarboxylate symporter
VRKLTLTQWIVVSVVAGIAAGVLFQIFAPNVFGVPKAELSGLALVVRSLLEFAKQLFLNMLKMIIVPLILTSIISGVLAVGDGEGLGRIGIKTLIYYLSTSTIAILTGLLLVNLIRPGIGGGFPLEQTPGQIEVLDQTPFEFLLSFVLDLIPLNPFRAMIEGDILQVIVFSLLIGFFITRIPQPHRGTLSRLFQGGFEVMMRIVHFVFLFAPAGIFALLTIMVASVGLEAFRALFLYSITVLLALMIHAGVTLPLILGLVGRVNPLRHAGAMWPALTVAFSTASSSGALPLTMECAEKRAGVSNRVTSFVLPLGATVNMDGTALYECVAAIFIAQIYVSQGVIPPLTVSQQLLVVVTALGASIGAAGVPMAGLVMMSIILKALGLPLESVGYILAVDRVLDMCRTSVNVWSDSCGVAVIARSEGETGIV